MAPATGCKDVRTRGGSPSRTTGGVHHERTSPEPMPKGSPMKDHDSAVNSAEFSHFRPTAALRPYVAYCTGYREWGGVPRRHRGLPSPYLTMIFTLYEPLDIAVHPDPDALPCRYDALIGGLHTRPALITHDGRQSGIQLALTPRGCRALIGLPAGELAGTDVDAVAVLGRWAGLLRDRLVAAPGWPDRFALLEAALLRRMRTESDMPADMTWAWRRLLGSGGTVTVTELAAELGCSDRHLRGRFRAETGLGPKEAGRVIRFHHATRLLRRAAAGPAGNTGPAAAGSTAAGSGGDRPTLADVAAACGFYDQAHLAREFTAFAGCPPSRWLAEEFRNLQAPPPPSGEESVA